MNAREVRRSQTDVQTSLHHGWVPLRSCLPRWVLVVAAWSVLHVFTLPALALPAPWHTRALWSRLASDGRFVGMVALAHLAVTVVGWYAVSLVTAGIVLRLVSLLLSRGANGPPPALRFLPYLAVPGTRALLAWSVGIASLGGSLLPTSAAFAAGDSSPPHMIVSSGGGESAGGRAPPVMSLLPAPRTGTSASPASAPPASASPASAAPASAPPASAPPASAPKPSTPPASAPRAAGRPGAAGTPPAGTPEPAAKPGAQPTRTSAGLDPLRSTLPFPGQPDVPPAAAAPSDVAPTTTAPGRWIVRPGDHLWSISERTLAAAWGAPPALAELGPYWWRVVTANRATLPNPADIDLLFPGDVVTLPPLPPPP